jgi:hypothetical protein
LAKTQEITKKDYMNVFILAKEIQAKNTSFDQKNIRKNIIIKQKEKSKTNAQQSRNNSRKSKSVLSDFILII